MQGFLDHLEPAPRGSRLGLSPRRKAWTRRFAKLNANFQTLELFVDATLTQRVARIDLASAEVATADELGELLFAKSAAIPVEHTRRFVFRIATSGLETKKELFYLCAEQPTDDSDVGAFQADAAASRACLSAWLRALKAATVSTAATVSPMLDMRDVHAKLTAFTDALFVSSHVNARHPDPTGDPHKPGQYEISCVAWTLQRERVPLSRDDQWQVLEYACEWRVHKTSAQLRDFDAQLRLRGVGDELRDVALPSFHGVRAFLHHQRHHDAEEDARRATLMDAYWQKLLCLPAFSVFGGDGAAMLDFFLELSKHLGGFKKLETASGQSLHLRNKRVVPWRERETFEQLFNIHQEMVRADEEKRSKQPQKRREPSERPHSQHQKERHRSSRRASEKKPVVETVEDPAPAEVVAPPEPVDSVHDRIARIGHKLLVEAFTTPAAAHVES